MNSKNSWTFLTRAVRGAIWAKINGNFHGHATCKPKEKNILSSYKKTLTNLNIKFIMRHQLHGDSYQMLVKIQENLLHCSYNSHSSISENLEFQHNHDQGNNANYNEETSFIKFMGVVERVPCVRVEGRSGKVLC